MESILAIAGEPDNSPMKAIEAAYSCLKKSLETCDKDLFEDSCQRIIFFLKEYDSICEQIFEQNIICQLFNIILIINDRKFLSQIIKLLTNMSSCINLSWLIDEKNFYPIVDKMIQYNFYNKTFLLLSNIIEDIKNERKIELISIILPYLIENNSIFYKFPNSIYLLFKISKECELFSDDFFLQICQILLQLFQNFNDFEPPNQEEIISSASAIIRYKAKYFENIFNTHNILVLSNLVILSEMPHLQEIALEILTLVAHEGKINIFNIVSLDNLISIITNSDDNSMRMAIDILANSISKDNNLAATYIDAGILELLESLADRVPFYIMKEIIFLFYNIVAGSPINIRAELLGSNLYKIITTKLSESKGFRYRFLRQMEATITYCKTQANSGKIKAEFLDDRVVDFLEEMAECGHDRTENVAADILSFING